jgi:HK97 family phage major capsid protein
MNQALELRQQRAALIDQAGQVIKAAGDQKRAMTPEEEQKYDRIFADASALRSTIEKMEAHDGIAKELEESRAKAAANNNGKDKSPDLERERRVQAIRGFLLTGNVPAEFRDMMQPASQDSPNFRAAAQTIGTGSTGGFTVPQGFWAEVQAALKYYGGMRESNTRKINTDSGNPLPIPTSDDTANVGRLLAENQPVTNTEVSFGQVTLNAYKWSSDSLLVPFELLQDSGVDIEAFLVSRLAERLGRIQNQYFTTGTGTSQPQGVVTGATLGKTAASATVIIYSELIDLKYSVNRAYRRNAQWMTSDTNLKVILKMVDGNSRPLFDSLLAVSLQSGEPDRLLGQPLIINNDITDIATTVKSYLYGDFANYWIRDVMAMMLLRLVERYADNGQVGFIAFMRSDGRLVDAGQHPIKYIQQA